MYKLFSRLSTLARGVCHTRADPLNTAIRPLNAALSHTESSAPVSLQGAPQSDDSADTEAFSFYPPFPGQESSLRWGGKKYEELPIAHVKATYNNTHIQVTDHSGNPLVRTSCGTEGFKNAKKSTPIAAQTAAISAAAKAQGKGVTYVRVVLKGLGQGRASAIRGLTMGGLDIVSITDNTPVPHNGCRPRKARRM
ncbi:28S ribosomal protein S11, mitochondrial-like [Scleropages formosus]|uniref:Small ribosomal subunit protein uS11m n=1 Tax=Scleropages formosus TaxID=113540 RepID=A0A0P7VC55_SCLFO|nr:28S ribosomal protein S11, mitochondrial [Scleropages formosus]KPP80045.1 28S ribosomal protein S11, mitochondrial-like [Scleropages formosus]